MMLKTAPDLEVTAREAIASFELLYELLQRGHLPDLNEQMAIERDIQRFWKAVGGRK